MNKFLALLLLAATLTTGNAFAVQVIADTIKSGDRTKTWTMPASTGTVAGTLVTQGGTGTTTQFTLGSILFAGASGVYSQDNSNFFWDDTNNRVGIGTTAPATSLHISGNHVSGKGVAYITGNAGQDGYISINAETAKEAGFILNKDGNAKWYVYMPTAGSKLSIYDAGSNKDAMFFWSAALISLGANGNAVPAAQFHQDTGTATATYHKFTAGSTTGILSTDGFDVGITSAGVAELRQRENLALTMYTNNTLAVTVSAAQAVTLAGALNVTGTTTLATGLTGVLKAASGVVSAVTPLPVADTTVGNQTLTTCSTARTIDWSTGNSFTVLLTNANTCAFTFSNAVSGQTITLDIYQPASTGSGAASWATTTFWAGGTAPTITTGASKTDTITIKYNGTDYRGSYVQDLR